MAMVGNFSFLIFLWLTWEFVGLESDRGGSVSWSNIYIIDIKIPKGPALLDLATAMAGSTHAKAWSMPPWSEREDPSDELVVDSKRIKYSRGNLKEIATWGYWCLTKPSRRACLPSFRISFTGFCGFYFLERERERVGGFCVRERGEWEG